ncbi:hypothetical protein [Leifsonia poae]|nr:hypothetical protein [Leifsonia poae]
MSKLVGGEWTVDTRSWFWCALPNGSDGAQFMFLATRSGVPLQDSPQHLAEQAQKLWAQRGIEAGIDLDEQLDPSRRILSSPAWLTGTDRDGRLLHFIVGDNYAIFGGDSRCVEGEPNDQML